MAVLVIMASAMTGCSEKKNGNESDATSEQTAAEAVEEKGQDLDFDHQRLSELMNKKTYFFINPRGEKVFLTLVMNSKATVNPIRPLSDGLRDDIPVYAELSADNKVDSPYGAATSGFMVLMFDPCKRYADTDMETYIFCAPFKVVGSQVDADGREWLVAEGGDVTFGNLKVNPQDPLMYLYINMAMAFDGHSSPTCIPRRYRIEILDRDKEKDEFTFGELQTYSAAGGGWVDAQNKAAQKVTKGLIVTKVDKGFDADLVRGVRMKPSQKRTDVNWYPPSLWYDNNETTLRRIVEQMGNAYRTYQSDYDKLFDK